MRSIEAAVGCWIMAREVFQQLPQGPLYWHLDGGEHHRSLMLILHDASQPAVVPAPLWDERPGSSSRRSGLGSRCR